MRLQKSLFFLFGISCFLLTAACVERQVPASSVKNAPTEVGNQERAVAPDANTKDYVHGWTFPTGANSGRAIKSEKSKESRERMLPSETDSYRRAWTFPTDGNGTAKESLVPPASSADKQQMQPPPTDTEEFLNGWTFE